MWAVSLLTQSRASLSVQRPIFIPNLGHTNTVALRLVHLQVRHFSSLIVIPSVLFTVRSVSHLSLTLCGLSSLWHYWLVKRKNCMNK